MDNTIDIRELLNQSPENAETTIEEATARTMFSYANIIYDIALSERGFGAGDPGEGTI